MLVIDTREKPKAIAGIEAYLRNQQIPSIHSKLIVGDYMLYDKPHRVIDRKQYVSELAKNCTADHKRFKAELELARDLGVELIILVEQDRYYDRGNCVMLRTIDDLMLWSDPYMTVRGEQVYRILSSWTHKYNIRIEFCRKCDTGRRIMEILNDER